ncbi:UNVERIFIED_CONTAM: hypothetical protein FKN15_026024 [Acipenser sinensis]
MNPGFVKQAVPPVKARKVPLKSNDPGAEEVVAEAAVLGNPLQCQLHCSSCRHASHAIRFTRSSTKDSNSSCIASTNRHSGEREGWHYLGNYKSQC